MSNFIERLPTGDALARAAAERRQTVLTKPPGSLGRLEELAIQIASWQGTATPAVRPAATLLFASDHPVTRHGISPYPSEVTRAMVANFHAGGAAASVLSRAQGLPLTVVDVGVDGGQALCPTDDFVRGSGASLHRDPAANVPAGDIRTEDALDPDGFALCIEAGRRAVRRLGDDTRAVLLGEMGIGNTTPAAAIAAALLRASDPGSLVGAGTGASGDLLENKRRVVRDAVRRVQGETAPLEILRRLGGRELVALFGAYLEALETRRIVVVDGFIATVPALVLHALAPHTCAGMVFSHRSDEQGHGQLLAHMGAAPLLSLGLRLGEASGALTAFSLLEHACTLHTQMATFDSAGVPDRTEEGG